MNTRSRFLVVFLTLLFLVTIESSTPGFGQEEETKAAKEDTTKKEKDENKKAKNDFFIKNLALSGHLRANPVIS